MSLLAPTALASWRGLRAVLVVALAAVIVTSPGCRCTPETLEERAEREAREAAEEKRRREEELARAALRLPSATVLPAGAEDATLSAKLGHWNEIAQPLVANTMDFDGELSHTVTTKEGQPLTPQRTAVAVESRRPMVVAQKSTKTSRIPVYFPPQGGPQRVRTLVRDRVSGAVRADPTAPTRPLLDHQYHVVVLAAEPSRYAFLDGLTCVSGALPSSIDVSGAQEGASTLPPQRNYRVVAPPVVADAQSPPRLPETPLAWTSIAYVFWDGIDPGALAPEQRAALVDWVHWGGQLIVSGPSSLDLLRGSELEPVLGVTGGDARRLTAEEVEAIDLVASASSRGPKPLQLGRQGWSAIRLEATGATPLPQLGSVLLENRVGRGRVVVSAFQLTEPALVAWSAGVENFFNSIVMRRRGRRFAADADAMAGKVVARWSDASAIVIDPLRNSTLRSFVRDTYKAPERLRLGIVAEGVETPTGQGGFGAGVPASRADALESEFRRLTPPAVRGGAGAWADDNVAVSAARDALRRSSGVSVPGAGFVLTALAAYLVVLVPLNWGFFYALGKTELAWLAAPLIAVGAALVVVQQAQLDIGFVRAQTEIGVLETQPGGPRGLLTRFSALYTSLTTSYDLEFETPTAIAAPFARLSAEEASQQAGGRPLVRGAVPTVSYERLEKARLRGLTVSSASTEFVRSEEMVDLEEASFNGLGGGGVALGRSLTGTPRLENRSEWDLADAALVRRRDGVAGPAELEGCWIGELRSGQNAGYAFNPLPLVAGRAVFADQRAAGRQATEETAPLDLEPLFALALDPERFEPGETRLTARIDGVRRGVAVTPAASQQRGATLLLAHLSYGPLPPPDTDANAPSDVRQQSPN